MKLKLNNLFKILTAGLICALASIFVFSGCTNKSAKLESPDASEYGLYTNLTLSIDSGDGKVWATVKNTFTFMPSTVRVSVELYKSATYKEDYTSMELASKNSVADLNIGKTLLTEASTNGEKAYWQARMFYKIDEKEWQEQTTKLWLIDGNGNMVNTVVTSPVEENITPTHKEETIIQLPDGMFTLKDVIDAKLLWLDYSYMYFYDNGNSLDVIDWKTKTIENADELERFYEIVNDIEVETCDKFDYTDGAKYLVNIKFSDGGCMHVNFTNAGRMFGFYVKSDTSFTFMSQANAFDMQEFSKYIELINQREEANQ